jgi:hypothetical protein
VTQPADDLDRHLAERWLDLNFAVGYYASLLLQSPPGVHAYISTACLHGHHDYCNAAVRPDGCAKEPAECKFCISPCQCPICHKN